MSRIATESSKYYALALHIKSQRSDKNEEFKVYAGCIKLSTFLALYDDELSPSPRLSNSNFRQN